MVGVTDIPDWCWVEGLGKGTYEFSAFNVPSPEQLTAMRERSPIAHIGAVKTPTIICLGEKDRRVPPSQGIEYYHLLKSRGVPTKLLIFPEDDHAIDHPASEAEQWFNVAQWIQRHI